MIASSERQPGSSANGTPGSHPDAQAPHPLEPLFKHLAVLREFALHYVEAQKDTITSAVRRALLKAVLGLLAAIIGATLLVASTVMVARGLAELISIAAGGRNWVGNLAIGGGVLVIVGAATAFYVSRALSAARKRIIEKYEHRHHAQRAKYGADVTQRAAL